MMNEKTLATSIFCLAISIIISAVIIANGMKSNGELVSSGLANASGSLGSNINNGLNFFGSGTKNNDVTTPTKANTFDLSAAAEYLGIAEITLKELVSTKSSGIPYIKNGTFYTFSKNALDKWLETARVEIK